MSKASHSHVTCESFDRHVYAFQAGELSGEEHERFQTHLDHCDRCARALEVETSFLAGFKGRLERTPAPPGLETRIRAALREEAPDPVRGAWSWLRAPWFAAAAACALLVGLLAVGLPLVPGPTPGGQVGEAVLVSRQGTIVDYDCDRAGAPLDLQKDCTHPGHVNALKMADGSYLQFSLAGEVSRDLVVDRSRRGSRVVVQGDYYPRIHTIEVRSLEPARDVH